MIITLIIFILTVLAMILSILFFPKIRIQKITLQSFWIITLIGAILMFLFAKIDINTYLSKITENTEINPLKIIILFFSMTFLSCFLDNLGLFKYLAFKAANLAKSSQYSIFTIFYFLISILTIFTSNDVIILTFTPFICYFAKNSKINPLPYLISEFIAANTLSMALLIGNPTNIYLSLSKNISFANYFLNMFIRSLIVCLITYFILLFIFRKDLKKKIIKEDINIKLENEFSIIVGLISLIICIILMALSSYLKIAMYLISLIFAIIIILFSLIYELILRKNKRLVINTIKKLPFALIPFLMSMFAIVISLENSGFIDKIASLLSSKQDIISIGLSSFFVCSITNNIPMSILYSSILKNGAFSLNATYSAIIGSNLGALFSPVGALAGIMFINIINQTNTKFSYKDFFKYCSPLSLVLIVISLFSLYLF